MTVNKNATVDNEYFEMKQPISYFILLIIEMHTLK
jgi:hypothetical protein